MKKTWSSIIIYCEKMAVKLKKERKDLIFKGTVSQDFGLKVGTNENGSACGRWLSIGIYCSSHCGDRRSFLF